MSQVHTVGKVATKVAVDSEGDLPDPQSPWEFTLDGEPEGHIAVEDLIAFMKREGA